MIKESIISPLCIALIASMTQAFGISLQRKSHLLDTSQYKQTMWISGFLIYTISNMIGSTCTIGYLPIVILAPVGAIGLVFNAIFAKWILGDPFTKRTIFGTGLIVLGAGLVAGFGTVPEPNHSLEDLIQLYKRPSFIIYFSIIEAFTILGLISTHVVEYLNRFDRWHYPNIKMWLGISYGVLGANISSQAMLFAKSGLELLILTIFQQDNQFIYPLTWMIVFALILTAILQLYYLNRGIQLCDTIILVPLNFCSFNVSCLFNGLVYYNQWDRLFWWQIIAVFIGITLLVCGVLLISLHTRIMLEEDVIDDDESSTNTPFLKSSSLLDEDQFKWWTRMKFIYQKNDNNEANENTVLLTTS